MNQGDFPGKILRKNAPCEERNSVIEHTKKNLKYLKKTNWVVWIGEMARLIKVGDSKSQILTVHLSTIQYLSKIFTTLITGVADVTNHDLRVGWNPNCECRESQVFGKNYRQCYGTKHRFVRSGCNVISCYLKLENMVYCEQRLRGKFVIIRKKVAQSYQRIMEHFKMSFGKIKMD